MTGVGAVSTVGNCVRRLKLMQQMHEIIRCAETYTNIKNLDKCESDSPTQGSVRRIIINSQESNC